MYVYLRNVWKDIDGSKPKKQAVWATRELMDNKDIECAHPKKFKVYFRFIKNSLGTQNTNILITQT